MPANVDYDIKKLVNEGKFDDAKEIMAKNHYNQTLATSLFRDNPTNENILNFINSFETPNWKHYVPFLSKDSTLKFFEFAQQNHVNLFEKTNEHNDLRLIDLVKDKLTGSFGHDASLFFKALTTATISKALLQEDTFLMVKEWLEKDVYLSEYNNPNSSTHILLEKLNTSGLVNEENHQKLFYRNNFTKQLLELNYNDTEKLFNKYPNFFSNKEELLDTKALLSFYHHGELKDFAAQRLEKAIETKKFNPNYEILHGTTKDNILKGEFGFSLIMESPKYAVLKKLLDNKLLPTALYNCSHNDQEPTFFERFLANNLQTYKKKNDKEYFFNMLQEIELWQNYGVEKRVNITSHEKMNTFLEKFLGIEETRGFFMGSEKVKIDKDIEELARDIGLHPIQAQKLVEFLDKRYDFTPDLKKSSENEQQIRSAWNNLMNQVIFKEEVKNNQTMFVNCDFSSKTENNNKHKM